MRRTERSTFTGGVLCGAALAIAGAVLLGHADDPQQSPEPAARQYFVTGDTSAATLWRREPDGRLTCVSVNSCRRPVGE